MFPLITTLPVTQIVELSFPVKTGKTVKLMITVESRLNGPTLVNISIPVGVAALYVFPLTTTLPVAQIVIVTEPVKECNFFS